MYNKIILFVVFIGIAVAVFAAFNFGYTQAYDLVKSDVSLIVQAINANNDAINFLSGCKVTQDNNTSVVLTCLKPVQ
jgi:uncharacterized protein (UPF0333 family)